MKNESTLDSMIPLFSGLVIGAIVIYALKQLPAIQKPTQTSFGVRG